MMESRGFLLGAGSCVVVRCFQVLFEIENPKLKNQKTKLKMRNHFSISNFFEREYIIFFLVRSFIPKRTAGRLFSIVGCLVREGCSGI